MALRAGIDIGTNTILLLVAEVNGEDIRVKEDHVTVVRLGQGVDENRAFLPAAMERARDCFATYAKILEKYPGIEVRAAATSGSRDAKNSGDFFRDIGERFGIPVRVITGEEEARLSFRGALPPGGIPPQKAAVLDIGGGSSEVVAFSGGELIRHSFDLGCVRLAERFLKHDPALGSEIQKLREFVDSALGEQQKLLNLLRGKTLVAVAGTATYLAAGALGLSRFDAEAIDGAVITLAEVRRMIGEWAPLRASERLGLGGMDQGRADVIVAGACILEAFLEAAEIGEYRASVRGLRYGLVLD